MTVLVDTPVWSMALRRPKHRQPSPEARELSALIAHGRVLLAGPVRQEILSGLRETAQFAALREHLRAFPDAPITTADYEGAAELFSQCRNKGIQGSNTDFLLCAIAINTRSAIYTLDRDFLNFQRVLPIRLHTPATETSSPD